MGQTGIRTLAELIQHQAAATPDAVAVSASHSARGMTYGQLGRHLGEVRRSLRQAGIRQDHRVAVVLPNGPEMATAFLAVAAACVCAPLNPSFREIEFQFYLSDLEIKALVLADHERGAARTAAQTLGIPVLELTPAEDGPAGAFALHGSTISGDLPDREVFPEDIALVLHTSGTTARPKIVPLSHRNLCASADNIRRTLQLTPADRCLNVMPLFHIHGLVGALLSSMSAGASVACCPPFDADRFFGWWESVDPTWYTAVPTIHQAVLAQIERRGRPPAPGSLRLIRSSSSSLPPAVMQRLEDAFGVPVLESYGMTEAAHQMASNPLPPLVRKPGSVGVAAGPEMAIMNDAGELLPIGATGEIVIRGENVTAGYANNPAANAASFTHGWFRTGDQGWQDEDGYFQITGRLKELINRGGEKVAPREVDDALLELPGVAQAVTFAVPHPRLGEDVAAAVVLRPGTVVTESELRRQALQRLTALKTPSRIVFVDEIPKGGTGKVQRIGLHEKLQHLLVAAHAAPEGAVELRLASLWKELLDVTQVGRHDNFFALGGDSILAARAVNRLNSDFRQEIPIALLFERPTLGEFAEALTALREGEPDRAAAPLVPIRSRAERKSRIGDLAGGGSVASADKTASFRPAAAAPLKFSLSFFSADGTTTDGQKYRLVQDCARFADQAGFTAIWLPERHFSTFGGLYPSPSVLGAAIAVTTERIQIRAGSVVLPLHDPLRVAEEWSVLDNLSHGRVAIACASGWHPNDFVLAPQNYADRRRITRERIEIIRRLWQGQEIRLPNGMGESLAVKVLPRPVQAVLPIWLTAHSDATFELAGEIGANIYTNIWKTDLNHIASQIALYRKSWDRHQRPGTQGTVTLMIHTFLGETDLDVLQTVSSAYGEYLQSFLELRETQAHGASQEFHLPPDERDQLVAFATGQLLESRGLMGTPERCLATLETIQQCGVDEVACLVDFGVSSESVLMSLSHLAEVKRRMESAPR